MSGHAETADMALIAAGASPDRRWSPRAARSPLGNRAPAGIVAAGTVVEPGVAAASPSPGATIGARFAAGATSGFDYLRLALSLIVIFWHSSGIVAAGHGERNAALQLFARIAVPMFFALSGFLVSASLDRGGDVARFLTNRLLRVLPALAVVVVLSALVVGPLFTSLPLRDYFTAPGFAAYFLNLVGSFHVGLPGVFAAHPPAEVNRSLWTIPVEVQCYLALAALFVAGGFRRTAVLVAGLIVATALCAWVYRDHSYLVSPSVAGRTIMLYFLAGTIVYRLRYRLPGGPLVATALLALGWLMLADEHLTLLSPLVLAWAAAAIGCTAPRRPKIVFDGDYSYGLYLYGMPVQQMLVAMVGAMPLWVHFPLSVAVAGGVAALSWRFVEKPALALKARAWHRPAPTGTAALRLAR